MAKQSAWQKTNHPGVWWKNTPAGKQLWIQYEGPRVWKDGKSQRNQKWEQVASKAVTDAKNLREQRRLEVRHGLHGERSDSRFSQLLAQYRASVVEIKPKRNTRQRYSIILDHFDKRFGSQKVEDVTAEDLEQFLGELVVKYKPSQVQQIWGRLKDVFRWALAKEYLLRNPFDRVLTKPPKIGRIDQNPLTPAEVDQFLGWLRSNELEWYPHYRFWIDSGLRQGELLAVKWQNLDISLGQYNVEEQIFRDSSYGPPKDDSFGPVALSPDTMAALEAHRKNEVERCEMAEPPTSGLIWCQPTGKHYCYRSESKRLERFLSEAKIEPRSPHQIRHTTASYMIADGATIVQVSGQLRHSDPSITLKHYAHLFPSDLRPAFRPKVVSSKAA